MHIFLHLLLPLCSLPAAAWLCAGSLVVLGLGWSNGMLIGMTCLILGLRNKRKVFTHSQVLWAKRSEDVQKQKSNEEKCVIV